jgi:hypothetical protein
LQVIDGRGYFAEKLEQLTDWVARTTEVLHRRTEALTARANRTRL